MVLSLYLRSTPGIIFFQSLDKFGGARNTGMHLALLTTFAASRKEPLASVLERVHAGIITAGFGEPSVRFTFSEGPITRVSSVGRVLKRLPRLERFAQSLAPCHGAPQMRVLSNRTSSGAIGETVDFTNLLEIARGVPRSFPFHNVVLIFSVPVFYGGVTLNSTIQGGQMPGITVTDSWWVNARQRSLTALTIVEAEPAAKKLPAPPGVIDGGVCRLRQGEKDRSGPARHRHVIQANPGYRFTRGRPGDPRRGAQLSDPDGRDH
jgi:hypothetical protein